MPPPITLEGPYHRRRCRAWRAIWWALALVLLVCLLPAVPHIAAALAAWLYW